MKKKEKVVVFGGSGFLGSHFISYQKENFDFIAPSHTKVNITKPQEVYNFLKKNVTEVVINAIALADVNEAEKEKRDKEGEAYKLNALAVNELALVCKKLGKHLILLSTDCVFDGRKIDRPYTEEDKPKPINWYGQTKYFGELFLKNSGCSYTIARIEMTYSPNLSFDKKVDFIRFFFNHLLQNKEVLAINDQKITPTFMGDAAKALGIMIKNKRSGIFHIGATDWISPYAIAQILASEFNFNPKLIKPVSFKEFSKNRAPRPQYPWLDVTKFQQTFGYNILHTNKEGIKLFKRGYKNF